jgi:hypothetical protein
MDTLHDHLSTLNEDTPRIKVSSESPITPELVFGLDTQLFSRQGEEGVDWEKLAGEGAGSGKWHGDEAVLDDQVEPISKETLEAALSKLSFEIYRGESKL